MKLVLEIAGHHPEDAPVHRAFDNFPVTAGRGYHNDVILADPHAGESHLRIDRHGEVWMLTDLGTLNPTLVNGRPCGRRTVPLASGDALRVGGTVLRVFSPAHPVAPPHRLHKTPATFVLASHPVAAWALFAFAVALVTGWSWLSVWTEDVALTLSGVAAGVVGAVLLWAGLWSVAGRLIRRHSFFTGHVACASLYFIANVAAWHLGSAIAFFTSEGVFSRAADYALNAGLLGLLLYGALSLATRLRQRRRAAAAVFFACGLMIGAFAVTGMIARRFSPDPQYPWRLIPFGGALAPARTVEGYMAGAAELFDSPDLEVEEGE